MYGSSEKRVALDYSFRTAWCSTVKELRWRANDLLQNFVEKSI